METKEEISIVKAQPEHFDQVIKLIKESFFPREPLLMAIGLSSEEYDDAFWLDTKEMLNQGYSFVALNSSGRVVGCRISTIKQIERGKEPEPDYIKVAGNSKKEETLKLIFRSLMAGWTKEVEDCGKVFEFQIMCVEEGYGGKGIAEGMVKRSLEMAEEARTDYIYVIATNWKSQRVFDKLGFTTIRTKYYEEFRDEKGNPLLKMTDGSTCMKWMIKKVNK